MKFKEVVNEMALGPKEKDIGKLDGYIVNSKDLKILETVIDEKIKKEDNGDDPLTIILYKDDSFFPILSKENRIVKKLLNSADYTLNVNYKKNIKTIKKFIKTNYERAGWKRVSVEFSHDDFTGLPGIDLVLYR